MSEQPGWVPVINRWSNQAYFTQTFSGWHCGVSRREYMEYWIERTGPLTRREVAAADRLRAVLQDRDGERILAAVLTAASSDEGAAVLASRWAPEVCEAWQEAVKAFAPRFESVWAEDEQRLRNHGQILSGESVSWLRDAVRDTDAFFGLDRRAEPLRVYLLLSAPGYSGGNGDMLTGPGGMTFECSGMKEQDFGNSLPGFIHEVMHVRHQPEVLRRLIEDLLADRDLIGQEPGEYAQTPICAMGVDFESYLGEVVLHSLWPTGALAWKYFPDCGVNLWRRFSRDMNVYDHWVFFPAHVVATMTRSYLDQGRVVDLQLLRHAYDIHVALRRHSCAEATKAKTAGGETDQPDHGLE